ncbi:MAG: hypothetical protein GKS07_10365 [Nitrosopumilus sp.]|nr:MAG: hypothetical protein GKS07_10365 [Nitrosopumilus sp.]
MSRIIYEKMSVKAPVDVIYEVLCDDKKFRTIFPEIWLIEMDHPVNMQELKQKGIKFVSRITRRIPYSEIGFTITSVDKDSETRDYQLHLKPSEIYGWTEIDLKIYPRKINGEEVSSLLCISMVVTGLSEMVTIGLDTMVQPAVATSMSKITSSATSAVTTIAPLQSASDAIRMASDTSLNFVHSNTLTVFSYLQSEFSNPKEFLKEGIYELFFIGLGLGAKKIYRGFSGIYRKVYHKNIDD